MDDKKINKIAKKIIASFMDSIYYFTSIEESNEYLNVCIRYYYPKDINTCLIQLDNIKRELYNTAKQILKYGRVKEYEFVNTEINGIEFGLCFIKGNENVDDDAVIDYLQKNGFKKGRSR